MKARQALACPELGTAQPQLVLSKIENHAFCLLNVQFHFLVDCPLIYFFQVALGFQV